MALMRRYVFLTMFVSQPIVSFWSAISFFSSMRSETIFVSSLTTSFVCEGEIEVGGGGELEGELGGKRGGSEPTNVVLN